MAIAQLECIRPEDPTREETLSRVICWCQEQKDLNQGLFIMIVQKLITTAAENNIVLIPTQDYLHISWRGYPRIFSWGHVIALADLTYTQVLTSFACSLLLE